MRAEARSTDPKLTCTSRMPSVAAGSAEQSSLTSISPIGLIELHRRGRPKTPAGHGPPALLGSLERFFGILLEHYAGNFPVWLAPEQAVVLPVTERAVEYADSVVRQLKDAGSARAPIRGRRKSDSRFVKLKCRKLPYMLIVGIANPSHKRCRCAPMAGRTWVHKRSRMSRPESGRPAVRKPGVCHGNLKSEEGSHGDA